MSFTLSSVLSHQHHTRATHALWLCSGTACCLLVHTKHSLHSRLLFKLAFAFPMRNPVPAVHHTPYLQWNYSAHMHWNRIVFAVWTFLHQSTDECKRIHHMHSNALYSVVLIHQALHICATANCSLSCPFQALHRRTKNLRFVLMF